MPIDLEQQLPRFAEALDREAAEISMDEIIGRGAVAVDVERMEPRVPDEVPSVAMSWGDTTTSDDVYGERDVPIELAWSATEPPARRRVGLKLALAAAAVALLVVALASIVRIDHETDPAGVPPSTSPSIAPASTGVPFPELTTTFVSPRNGFSIRYLDRGEGTISPATQLWGFSKQPDDGFDAVETGLAAVFKGTSTEMPGYRGLTDDWIDEYVSKDEHMAPGACGEPRSQQAEITIDGQSGRISECANRIEATVVAGGRLYYFVLLHDRRDARAVFDAFAATIDLTPETAVDFPAFTATFVSPTSGFSFEYLDRGEGTLTPATQLWDPVAQPIEHESGAPNDDPFDVVETGLAAVFKGASTTIPDGVPIDQWVDEYVSPGGCDAPRSQQEAITIDGHAGTMTKCLNRIDATVVAGRRLYYFVLLHDRSDARAFFDTWVETIHLTPDTAAVR